VQGATAGILAFLRAVLLPVPRYPLYSAAAVLHGARVLRYALAEERAWALDRASLLACVRRARDRGLRPKACVVVSPGNPTGTIFARGHRVRRAPLRGGGRRPRRRRGLPG
jgi:aspartate/methionine/tyrosine aminotransferase